MKRLMLATLLAGLAVFIAAPGGQQPIAFDDTGSTNHIQCYLDHQGTYPDPDQSGWVHNPTDCGADPAVKDYCGWNDQDNRMRLSAGYVEGTWVDQTCLFSDFTGAPGENRPHSVYVNVYAATDSLDVVLSNDAGDSWNAGPSVAAGNRRKWRICVRDAVADRAGVPPQADPSLYFPEVPFSNGGYATRVNYFLTLTALGGRARDVTAMFEVAGSGPVSAAPRAITDCP